MEKGLQGSFYMNYFNVFVLIQGELHLQQRLELPGWSTCGCAWGLAGTGW